MHHTNIQWFRYVHSETIRDGNPWERLKWPNSITRLTAHFICGLMSDMVICKFWKSMVMHDTECPYWDQVSLNNTNQTSGVACFHVYPCIQVSDVTFSTFRFKRKIQKRSTSNLTVTYKWSIVEYSINCMIKIICIVYPQISAHTNTPDGNVKWSSAVTRMTWHWTLCLIWCFVRTQILKWKTSGSSALGIYYGIHL